MENKNTYYFLKIERFFGGAIVSKINEIQLAKKPNDTDSVMYFDTYNQAKMYQDLATFKRR